MEKVDFINKIAKIVAYENALRDRPLYSSVVIAQACLETGYGSSNIMMKANAVFGIKATSNWKGKVYNARTNEVYSGITTNITAYFRAYDSLEESVSDYFDLICGLDRYKQAINAESPEKCIFAIKQGGYATDPNYDRLVINIIKDNNLTKYDTVTTIYDNSQLSVLETTIDRAIENTFKCPFDVGKNYTLQVNLNVRYGAGTNKGIKKYSELTEDGKKHATNKTVATLKKGTIVTVQEIKFLNNEIWLKIPSGWIAGYYRGEYYVN